MGDALRRGHPRALEDNPEGLELIGDAVRRTIELGLHARCKRAGGTASDLDFDRADIWDSVYVPDPAAEEGEALLSTLETPASDEPDVAPTRRVGLEHTGLRPFGKVGIVLFIAGVLIGGAVTIAFDRPRSRGPGRCARGRRGSARLERADGTPAG